jgi:hypothetical protein
MVEARKPNAQLNKHDMSWEKPRSTRSFLIQPFLEMHRRNRARNAPLSEEDVQ